jgi:CBS domain-containing protein
VTAFEQPVSGYMTTDLETVSPDASLDEVARKLADRRISAVPVVADGAVLGVVSRSDLLHAGNFQAMEHSGRVALELPDRRAIDLVTGKPRVCQSTTSLRDAAREMRRYRIHRLFVVGKDGRPIGVISTLDLTAAVRDARSDRTLGDLMTSPVITVPASAKLAEAVDLLDRAHVTGLVVHDERWPIGMFTQAEALAARDLPGSTPIDDLHDPSLICLPVTTIAYRAAAQAAHLDVRRVIACRNHEAVGIVTGLDFAALVAA